MVGTAIAAGVAAAAGIASGIMKTHAARQQQRKLQYQMDLDQAKNEAWYLRRSNEDILQRSYIQDQLRRAQDELMKSSRAAAGTSEVQGTSNATTAAQKQVNNEAYAKAQASIAAQADAKKDDIEKQYMQRDAQLSAQQAQLTQAKYDAQQAAIDTAAAGVQGAANVYMAGHTPATPSATQPAEDAAKLTAANTANAPATFEVNGKYGKLATSTEPLKGNFASPEQLNKSMDKVANTYAEQKALKDRRLSSYLFG